MDYHRNGPGNGAKNNFTAEKQTAEKFDTVEQEYESGEE